MILLFHRNIEHLIPKSPQHLDPLDGIISEAPPISIQALLAQKQSLDIGVDLSFVDHVPLTTGAAPITDIKSHIAQGFKINIYNKKLKVCIALCYSGGSFPFFRLEVGRWKSINLEPIHLITV